MSESSSERLVVAYSRVSSVGQNLDRQTEAFSTGKKFDRMYVDKISGVIPFAERPSGSRLLEDCRAGIVGEVHFHELSRLGRDMLDVLSTITFFEKSNIQVIIKKEGILLLDDNKKLNPTSQVVIAVLSALAGIERANLRERQREGIELAKLKGKYVGRRHGTSESTDRFLAKPFANADILAGVRALAAGEAGAA